LVQFAASKLGQREKVNCRTATIPSRSLSQLRRVFCLSRLEKFQPITKVCCYIFISDSTGDRLSRFQTTPVKNDIYLSNKQRRPILNRSPGIARPATLNVPQKREVQVVYLTCNFNIGASGIRARASGRISAEYFMGTRSDDKTCIKSTL
jgi:hypothetical protein